ncbi:MAG: hypothetical protein ACXVB7_16570 [Ktedonobacteraceae bacterium]
MNVELLVYVLLEIVVVLCSLLFWRITRDSNLMRSEANRRANELLRSVLTCEQYNQLTRKGYLDIMSPRDPGCMYRVPRRQGLVKVIEQGSHKANLCLQPREAVPDDDIVVMHKLMIEADEETYLQTANTFAPTNSDTWLNRIIWYY